MIMGKMEENKFEFTFPLPSSLIPSFSFSRFPRHNNAEQDETDVERERGESRIDDYTSTLLSDNVVKFLLFLFLKNLFIDIRIDSVNNNEVDKNKN
jgi:hypothetical protein